MNLIATVTGAFRDALATFAAWRIDLDRAMIRIQAITGQPEPQLRLEAIRTGRILELSPAAIADWMVDMLAVGVDKAEVLERCKRHDFTHTLYGYTIPEPWERRRG